MRATRNPLLAGANSEAEGEEEADKGERVARGCQHRTSDSQEQLQGEDRHARRAQSLRHADSGSWVTKQEYRPGEEDNQERQPNQPCREKCLDPRAVRLPGETYLRGQQK